MLTQDELYHRAADKWGPDPHAWRFRRSLPRVEALVQSLSDRGCPEDAIKDALLSSAIDGTRAAAPGEWSVAGMAMLLSLDLGLDQSEISEVFETVELMRAGRN